MGNAKSQRLRGLQNSESLRVLLTNLPTHFSFYLSLCEDWLCCSCYTAQPVTCLQTLHRQADLESPASQSRKRKFLRFCTLKIHSPMHCWSSICQWLAESEAAGGERAVLPRCPVWEELFKGVWSRRINGLMEKRISLVNRCSRPADILMLPLRHFLPVIKSVVSALPDFNQTSSFQYLLTCKYFHCTELNRS